MKNIPKLFVSVETAISYGLEENFFSINCFNWNEIPSVVGLYVDGKNVDMFFRISNFIATPVAAKHGIPVNRFKDVRGAFDLDS